MKTSRYYSGGLAEIVDTPTNLTYSLFKRWFTGKGSLGKAMSLLKLPHQKLTTPVLVLRDGELYLDLLAEEKTLYKNTIFRYAESNDVVPKQEVQLVKLFHPLCLYNTLRIVFTQAQWVAKPDETIKLAKKLLAAIPNPPTVPSVHSVESMLCTNVWPSVIAIGFLSEYFHQLLLRECRDNVTEVETYISQEVACKDWFFKAYKDQYKVKMKKMSFDAYLSEYSCRADKDYEVTLPRWQEIPETLKKRIAETEKPEKKQKGDNPLPQKQKLIETVIALQVLRSDAKKKALVWYQVFRTVLQNTYGNLSEKAEKSYTELIRGKKIEKTSSRKKRKTAKKNTQQKRITKGKGQGISAGNADGIVKHITDAESTITPDTIGIFPNASPEFTTQFPKCSGIIFLKGGMTSHGAIVAREFKIPALIDSQAINLKEGSHIQIDGKDGMWQLLNS